MFASNCIFLPRSSLFLDFSKFFCDALFPSAPFIIFSATLSSYFVPYFSLLKSYTMQSSSCSLFYPLSCVTIQVVCFFDFKLHSWHEIHQGEGVQKLYICRVVLSLRLFPVLLNSSLLLYCCCYLCYICVSSNYYNYSNLKERGEIRRRLLKKRDRVNIGGLERQFLGQYAIVLPHILYNPSVWHPTHRALKVIQGVHKLVS